MLRLFYMRTKATFGYRLIRNIDKTINNQFWVYGFAAIMLILIFLGANEPVNF